jgi:DNA-directed RNA polymerase specialized sigma24 family protein
MRREGLSLEEIAEIYGTNRETIRLTIKKALKKLKIEFARRGIYKFEEIDPE